jgi:hypothetical protein
MKINWEKFIKNGIANVVFTLLASLIIMFVFNYLAPKYGIKPIGFTDAVFLKCFGELLALSYKPSEK